MYEKIKIREFSYNQFKWDPSLLGVVNPKM